MTNTLPTHRLTSPADLKAGQTLHGPNGYFYVRTIGRKKGWVLLQTCELTLTTPRRIERTDWHLEKQLSELIEINGWEIHQQAASPVAVTLSAIGFVLSVLGNNALTVLLAMSRAWD